MMPVNWLSYNIRYTAKKLTFRDCSYDLQSHHDYVVQDISNYGGT